MAELTVDQKLQRIADWQNAGFVHPLTCGGAKCRAALVGKVDGDRLYLKCPRCSYRQDWIPPMVLTDYVDRFNNEIEKLRQAKRI